MLKKGAISRTSRGNPITRNPARIEFAAERLRHLTYTKARDAIVQQWGVGRATAERDIAAAKQLIALECNAIEVRVNEVLRNQRIADKVETAADEASARARAAGGTAAEWSAVAALHKTAIAASREIARLTGAHAPREVKVSHPGSVEVALQIDAVLNVLDDREQATKNGCSGGPRAYAPSRIRAFVPDSLRSAWASRLPSFLGALRFVASRLGASRP